MTAQEYYDALCTAAYDGTFPSVTEKGECLYRGPNGTRCAVGLLIPDEAYFPALEGMNVRHFFEKVNVLDVPEGFDLFDLMEVQARHDETAARKCGWRAWDFVRKINRLDCFNDVRKKAPGKATAPVEACGVHPHEGVNKRATEKG
jgi:hypothetical protein